MAKKTERKAGEMAEVVYNLRSAALSRGVSPYLLAPDIGVSRMTMFRWFDGVVPRPDAEKRIREAIAKLEKEIPAPEMLEKVVQGRTVRVPKRGAGFVKDDPADPALVCEKLRQFKMRLLFDELKKRCQGGEATLLKKNWSGFDEILGLVRKYGLKVPR